MPNWHRNEGGYQWCPIDHKRLKPELYQLINPLKNTKILSQAAPFNQIEVIENLKKSFLTYDCIYLLKDKVGLVTA